MSLAKASSMQQSSLPSSMMQKDSVLKRKTLAEGDFDFKMPSFKNLCWILRTQLRVACKVVQSRPDSGLPS